MAAVALLLMGVLGAVAFHDGSGPMALLYADLDLREAGQVIDQLDRARIRNTTEAGGTRVLVPVEQVDRARLLLARDGLPSGGSIGYEIFDRGDGLTATQFQQTLNQARALEGELSRTIRMIQGVRQARVHLVLPKREPFSREQQTAQASVVLTMASGRLDREGTQAIVNLVAAAVPGLRPQNIAVVDSRGNVLAHAGEPVGPAALAQGADDLRRTMQQRLSRTIEEMLERTLGAGRVRVETAIELDFDQVHETQEKFDPDGQVVRSQQSVTDNNRTTDQQQNVSVANNLPNADAGQSPSGTQDQRQEETTNYEVGKTVRTVVRDQPQVRRISVAVLVDGGVTRAEDGTGAYAPRSAEELASLATLVRSAIGFNEGRGDKVEVVNMRFASADDAADGAPRGLFGLPIDKADLMRIGETGVIALVAVLAMLLVLRPMALKIGRPIGTDVAMLPAEGVEGAGDAAALLEGEDELVDVTHIEGQMRASSIRRIAELVERNPEASVAIVRSWITEEAA